MTAEDLGLRGTPPVAGPLCDLCQDEPGVESVMHLATYDQVVIGASCLLAFHQGVVASLTEAEPPAEGPGAAVDDEPAGGGEPPGEPPGIPAKDGMAAGTHAAPRPPRKARR